MIPKKLQSEIDDLEMFQDRSDRIEALISLGEEFTNPGPDVVPRTEANRVKDCESEVFVVAGVKPDGSFDLHIAVDNSQGISAMALAVILERGLAGSSPSDVTDLPEQVVYDIFGRELSMGKSMGLTGVIRMIRADAQRASA